MSGKVVVNISNSDYTYNPDKFKQACLFALGGSWDNKANLVVNIMPGVKLIAASNTHPCIHLDSDFLGRNIYFDIGDNVGIYGHGGTPEYGVSNFLFHHETLSAHNGGDAFVVDSGVLVNIKMAESVRIVGGGGAGETISHSYTTSHDTGEHGSHTYYHEEEIPGGTGGPTLVDGVVLEIGSVGSYYTTSYDSSGRHHFCHSGSLTHHAGSGGAAGQPGKTSGFSGEFTGPGSRPGRGLVGQYNNAPPMLPPTASGDLVPTPIVDYFNDEVGIYGSAGIAWGTNSYPEHADPSWFGGTTYGVDGKLTEADIRNHGDASAEASDIESILMAYTQKYARIRKMRIIIHVEGGGVSFDSTQLAHCHESDAASVWFDTTNSGPEHGLDATFEKGESYSVVSFIDRLKQAYLNAREQVIVRENTVCHSSCHNNCHGSRNRR